MNNRRRRRQHLPPPILKNLLHPVTAIIFVVPSDAHRRAGRPHPPRVIKRPQNVGAPREKRDEQVPFGIHGDVVDGVPGPHLVDLSQRPVRGRALVDRDGAARRARDVNAVAAGVGVVAEAVGVLESLGDGGAWSVGVGVAEGHVAGA